MPIYSVRILSLTQPCVLPPASGPPSPWARWRDPISGEPLETFTILTVAANPDVAEIHDRMPVLLPPGKDRDWVKPKTPPDELHTLIAPPEAGQLAKHPVASTVNSPVNDAPTCITHLPETPELF